MSSHPARFPLALPQFFVRFLTDEGDLVVDIFSGSNTTGYAAERLNRRWLSIDVRKDFAMLSALRFMEGWPIARVRRALADMNAGQCLDITAMEDEGLLWRNLRAKT